MYGRLLSPPGGVAAATSAGVLALAPLLRSMPPESSAQGGFAGRERDQRGFQIPAVLDFANIEPAVEYGLVAQGLLERVEQPGLIHDHRRAGGNVFVDHAAGCHLDDGYDVLGSHR